MSNKMTFNQKISMAASFLGISQAELAKRMGMSPQSLNNRMKTGKFSQEDLDNFASALEAEITVVVKLKDGTVL